MPIEIRDTDNSIGNIIKGLSDVTSEEYITAMVNHLSQDNEKLKRYRYSLSDYTKVDKVGVSSAAINYVANLCKKAAAVNRDIIIGIAAEKDIAFGLSRMWELLSAETGWETMVFRTKADAENWIKERTKEKYGTGDLKFD